MDQAIEYGEMSQQKARNPIETVQIQLYQGWAMCRAGKLEGNIERIVEVVKLLRDGGSLTLQITYMPILAEAYMLAGQYDRARQTAQEAVEAADRCGAKPYSAQASRLLGEIALRTKPGEAPSHFERAISIFQEIKAENELALAYSGMGRYHKHQGNMAQGREYLSTALEILERLGTLIEPDKVRKELSELGSHQ